jgi:hypothetical protein
MPNGRSPSAGTSWIVRRKISMSLESNPAVVASKRSAPGAARSNRHLPRSFPGLAFLEQIRLRQSQRPCEAHRAIDWRSVPRGRTLPRCGARPQRSCRLRPKTSWLPAIRTCHQIPSDQRARHLTYVLSDAVRQQGTCSYGTRGLGNSHRIDRVDRSVLPLPYLAEAGVRNPADEVRRDIGRVEFGQVALDLSHRHATRIEAQNLLIEAVKPGLSLGDQLGLELPARSRGTAISTSPSSVRIVFELVRLRLLPLPRADRSPFS